MFIYAGIGSRSTPDSVLESMEMIGYQLAGRWLLRSGHADGADQAFENGVLKYAMEKRTQPKMEIYLPWVGFNGAGSSSVYIPVQSSPELLRVASAFHPAWHRCSPAAKHLHMRNVNQIAGKNLDTPADVVVCWTPQGRGEGGTGQAIRIANYLKIPVFDLGIPGNDRKFCDFVKERERQAGLHLQHNHGQSHPDRHQQQSPLRRVS